jgi:hypothetical protein
MTFIVDGTSGLTFPNSTVQASSGKVIQVVNVNKTDTFTSSAGSTLTDITGMSATITPLFSTSKIMVVVSMFGVFWQPGFNGVILNLVRGSTSIGGGDASGSRAQTIGTTITSGYSTSAADSATQYHLSYVDSPATTSSTTYKLQFWQDTPGNPIYVNRTKTDSNSYLFTRSSSSIILLEIAA